MKLKLDFDNRIKEFQNKLGVGESFDVLQRNIKLGGRRVTFFFIDGFVKDEGLQSLINNLTVYKSDNIAKAATAKDVIETCISAIEVTEEDKMDEIIKSILSGQTAMIIEDIEKVVMIDLRTYPSRGPQEPDKEKVLRGARDGFVETIVFNTALIRRRIRDPKLHYEMMSVGKESKTDVAIAYVKGRTDEKSLAIVRKYLKEIDVDALTLGGQSLIECFNKKSWYNPLPKVRYTERPDVTAAHIMEGKIALLIDNNPSAMLLPSSIFDFLQDVDDYYSPILTGNYLRLIRNIILFSTIYLTPLFILIVEKGSGLPEGLKFLLPTDPYHIPILLQFILLEIAIDGLQLASLNTPSALGMSLSVVGALILGEFSVSTGWFIPQTVLYMAIVALAGFTQQSIELGYAVKFFRIFLLFATALFGAWGLGIGSILVVIMIATTKTFTGESYMYPLIPFNWKKLKNVLFRTSITSSKK